MEEILFLNVDLKKRRVTPFPDDILEQIAVMKAAHSALPKPDILGQSVGIPPRAKSGKVGLH
jgi:acyl-CoA thioester hydrolase